MGRNSRWRDRPGDGGGAAPRSAGSGVRRLVVGALLVVGLLVIVLLVGAVVLGFLLVTNLDAALGWVDGVFDQVRPLVPALPELTGGS